MYVVVETDPETSESHVLYPRGTNRQIHASLEAAEKHRDCYTRHVYVEDAELGAKAVRVFRLKPVDIELPFAVGQPSIRRG
ncbi:MAG TPA: hypothetical protein VG845_02975 [Dehalococcoidia bacterium]|nr:hypothetical protein [Dehalococcoidia bacterium]